jgi:hypothetical protein
MERKEASGGGKFVGRGPLARPVRVTGQTGARQSAGQFGFRGHNARGLSPFGRGTDGRRFESGGVEFAGHSPPRDQYEFERGRNFQSQRGYKPCFPFCGTRTPLVRWEWFSHGCSRFERFDRMDRNFDRRGRMGVANPTFEEMARHWFDTFSTNPSVQSFAHSLLVLSCRLEARRTFC